MTYLFYHLWTNIYQNKVGYAEKADYYHLVIYNAGLDQNWGMNFIYFFDWFKNCERNDEKLHIRNIYIKYKIIIIVQYKIAEYVAFVVQSHNNYNKRYIDHLPSQFSL